MTLPTEERFPCSSVGTEGEDGDRGGIAVLDHPVEWMRFCQRCESEQRFLAECFCAGGLLAHCANCGDAVIARWTRTTTEVAS
jgi:hypothetical protein